MSTARRLADADPVDEPPGGVAVGRSVGRAVGRGVGAGVEGGVGAMVGAVVGTDVGAGVAGTGVGTGVATGDAVAAALAGGGVTTGVGGGVGTGVATGVATDVAVGVGAAVGPGGDAYADATAAVTAGPPVGDGAAPLAPACGAPLPPGIPDATAAVVADGTAGDAGAAGGDGDTSGRRRLPRWRTNPNAIVEQHTRISEAARVARGRARTRAASDVTRVARDAAVTPAPELRPPARQTCLAALGSSPRKSFRPSSIERRRPI